MNRDILNKQLIGSIFSQQDISNFRYELIQYENDLSKLVLNKFFTSINFCGSNCFLVFTKVANKHYCFTVDRQTLSYNFNKIDYNKVKIDIRNIRLDYEIYQGTILDGILVKQSKKDDIFIISDVYTFKGVNYTKSKLDEKLKLIREYLEEHYNEDHLDNNIRLSINKIFPIEQTEHLVNKVLPTIKELKYRGLCFLPEISDTKLIFMFKNEENNQESKKVEGNKIEFKQVNDSPKKIVKQIQKTKDSVITMPLENNYNTGTKYKYINTSGKDVYATLEVKPTDNIDVYKVNAIERIIQEGKKILKRVPLGIAYISGIKQSHNIRQLIQDNSGKQILMKCKYNDDKSKWEPIELDTTAKCPNLITDIDLEMMELSDSDE